MASSNRSFPPRKLSNLDRNSAGHFLELLGAVKNNPVSLVLGAGVSASAGLPPWERLLAKICTAFFEHWQPEMKRKNLENLIPPKEMSIAYFAEGFWRDKARDLSSLFNEQEPLLVAQQIKNCIRDKDWRYLLRKILYSSDVHGSYQIKKSELIESIVGFSDKSKLLNLIISYNWDNLVERELKEKGISVSPIWEGKQDWPANSLPIYYPHGYLPVEGGPVTNIILAESDYHNASVDVYSWANIVQIQAFSNTAALFIGNSMTDPNVRRFLNISRDVSTDWNYAFLPCSHEKSEFQLMSETLFDFDLSRLGVKVIRYPIDETSSNPYALLPRLINMMSKHLSDAEWIWN